MKLILTGAVEHNFSYEVGGVKKDVRVLKGQDILPLNLPDEVVATMKAKYRGPARRMIKYYTVVKEQGDKAKRDEIIGSGKRDLADPPSPILSDSPTVTDVEPEEVPEIDDPGAELAAELAAEIAAEDAEAEAEAAAALAARIGSDGPEVAMTPAEINAGPSADEIDAAAKKAATVAKAQATRAANKAKKAAEKS